MDVSWCVAHEPVSLLYHGSHIQVVTVVEKILKGKEAGKLRGICMEEEKRDRKVGADYGADFIFRGAKVVTSKSCFWEQSSRGSRQQVM